MRVTSLSVVAACLLLLGSSSAWAQEQPRAILDKAIQAHGGTEKLTRFQAGQLKTKGKIELLGGLEFTQEMSYQLPNRFKESMEIEIAGQKASIVTVYDGQKGWLKVDGKLQDLDEKLLGELKEIAHLMRVSRLVGLVEDKNCKLSALGEIKVAGRAAVGVKIECKGFRDINLYFDKQNGLMVKAERRALDPTTGQEVSEERIITEYSKVDGVQSPRKLTVYRDGQKFMEAEVTEVKILEKLDPATFARPI